MGYECIEYLIWNRRFGVIRNTIETHPMAVVADLGSRFSNLPCVIHFFSVSQKNIFNAYLEYGETYSWLIAALRCNMAT